MKLLLAAAALFVSLSAHASIGVVIGHHKWAADGLPDIGPGEQTKVFFCSGRGDARIAMGCALDKCLAHYNREKNPSHEIRGAHAIFGGVCSTDGWSARRGHALMMVGPPGDNVHLTSKALGKDTREEALRDVCRNGFPCDKATVVFDFYEGTGHENPEARKPKR